MLSFFHMHEKNLKFVHGVDALTYAKGVDYNLFSVF